MRKVLSKPFEIKLQAGPRLIIIQVDPNSGSLSFTPPLSPSMKTPAVKRLISMLEKEVPEDIIARIKNYNLPTIHPA